MPKNVIDPIAQLMQEHDETLHQLQKLNAAARGLSENGFTKDHFKQILASLEFINEEVTQHNQREEEALFPTLERYVEGPTQIMRNDHKVLYSNFMKFRKIVTRVEKKPQDIETIDELAAMAKHVVQIFVNHIHKENYILFPLVQKFLSKAELREVAKKMM